MKTKLTTIHNEVYLPIPLNVLRELNWFNGDELILDVPVGAKGSILTVHKPDAPVTHLKGVKEVGFSR